MNIAIWWLIFCAFEIYNDSLVFQVGSQKAEVVSFGYIGPPQPGYEHTEPKFIGEVKNIGEAVIMGLRVELTAYGERMHMLVNKREREVAFQILEPQEVSLFCIHIGDCIQSGEEIKLIKINLISRARLKAPQSDVYHGLQIVSAGIAAETTFVYDTRIINYYIVGEMLNKGEKTTQSNTIVALFYDRRGNLIDYTHHNVFGKLGGGEIPASDSRIFRLDIPEEVVKYKNYFYKLKILSTAK